MNKQEIVETIQEITGMAIVLGLTAPEHIRNYHTVFSDKFGDDIMNAFYTTTLNKQTPIYHMIKQALEATR